MASKLRDHRIALAANPSVFEADLPRLRRTLLPHLKRCGYPKAGAKAGLLVAELVELIFDAQGRRPLFHIDAPLPYCWNAPGSWQYDYIRYEWAHLRSRNQNDDAEQLDNLVLSSARCNQHIQTSMDIAEVRDWLDGSKVARRIDEVLENRAVLTKSARWRDLCERLKSFA